MLRGNSEAKIDEKGRLKIPAAFKRVLDDEFHETKFFVTSLDGETARVYPMQEWLKLEEKLKSSSFDTALSKLKFKVNHWGGEAEMDGQGRLLVPQVLRDKAGIVGEVSVMGMTNFLEVCTSAKAKERAELQFSETELERIAGMGI